MNAILREIDERLGREPDEEETLDLLQKARDEIERLTLPLREDREEPTDAEFVEAFGNASFGPNTEARRREIVATGILKVALCYGNGHTLTCILKDLGLITWGRRGPRDDRLIITPRGRYLCWKWFGLEERP